MLVKTRRRRVSLPWMTDLGDGRDGVAARSDLRFLPAVSGSPSPRVRNIVCGFWIAARGSDHLPSRRWGLHPTNGDGTSPNTGLNGHPPSHGNHDGRMLGPTPSVPPAYSARELLRSRVVQRRAIDGS